MAFEILGARIIAPFLGSSTYVWTSLIGVIMASLSIGYWFGGRYVDKYPKKTQLGWIVLLAGISIALVNLFKGPIASKLSSSIDDEILASFIIAVVLFTAPSFLLGTVSPWAVKLQLVESSSNNVGSTVGSLYALSTLGSLLGTFLAGWVLIPALGTDHIMWILALILFITSVLLLGVKDKLTIICIGTISIANLLFAFRHQKFIAVDTPYNKVYVINDGDYRFLRLNNYINSCVNVMDDKELYYPYSRFFRLGEVLRKDAEDVLMLGGGGYAYPRYFQSVFPSKKMDVVEIDAQLADVATNHLNFNKSDHIQHIHKGARLFLNQNKKKYHYILNDIISSSDYLPFQLCTIEAVKKQFEALDEKGHLFVNLMAEEDGVGWRLLKSYTKTVKEVFPYLAILISDKAPHSSFKSYMVIASKEEVNWEAISFSEAFDFIDYSKWLDEKSEVFVLTDAYAPVNWLIKS